MPSAVKELIRLVYVEQLDVTRVQSDDIAIIKFLKNRHPDLFRSLKKAAKEKLAR
jgi:hypothetical protein